MSLRWRKSGKLLCAAKYPEKKDDTYIDDRLHYLLSVELKVIVPNINESLSGEWHWLKDIFPVADLTSVVESKETK